jgi:hypothetical protein
MGWYLPLKHQGVSVTFWPPCLMAIEDSSSTCDGPVGRGVAWMVDGVDHVEGGSERRAYA